LMDRSYWSATAPPAPSPSSINYALAGNSVPVFGDPPGTPCMPANDPLYQHHLPTYRALMHAQLGPPAPQQGPGVNRCLTLTQIGEN
jgi:hypothetical protein